MIKFAFFIIIIVHISTHQAYKSTSFVLQAEQYSVKTLCIIYISTCSYWTAGISKTFQKVHENPCTYDKVYVCEYPSSFSFQRKLAAYISMHVYECANGKEPEAELLG